MRRKQDGLSTFPLSFDQNLLGEVDALLEVLEPSVKQLNPLLHPV